jgi:mannose-6-phosphate isomerase-like protein (cupin superfamily)
MSRDSTHDASDATSWQEPAGGKRAGFGKFGQPKTDYDKFMESEGVPVFRGIGVRTVKELPLADWPRLGGRGSYIQLSGTEGKWGFYVVEVPAAGALNVEKHLYEKVVFVVEGRGTTEVWLEEGGKKHTFEWQKGSMFSIPVNAYHRIVNASAQPATLMAGTTAPNLINLIGDVDFIFNCPYKFTNRFSESDDFYKPNDDVEPDPIRGLAMRRTNFIPDVVNADLLLDNRRSPGYRRVEPHMTGNKFYIKIGEHETGRYAKAHAHTSATVLMCVKGKGYTYTWPERLGVTPWADGKAEQVERVDYEPFGMVSAAPGGAHWYHQHFNSSKEPFRLIMWNGPNHPSLVTGLPPGAKQIDYTGMDIPEGGTSIPYWMEDPFLREEFERCLEQEGGKSHMEPSLYEGPKG